MLRGLLVRHVAEAHVRWLWLRHEVGGPQRVAKYGVIDLGLIEGRVDGSRFGETWGPWSLDRQAQGRGR